MTRSVLRMWIGAGLVGLLTTVGCRHAERSCECCCCCECETVRPQAITPVPARPVEVKPVTEAPAPAPKPAPVADDSQIQRATAQKVEPAHDVLATVVSPDAASVGGGIAGTMSLTSSEAESMGIRPGYTPGALYAPGSNPNPVLHLTGAKETPEK